MEIPTRKIVLGRWAPSSEATLWFSFQEKPRLPASRWRSQSQYWLYHGRLNPYC